MLPVTIYQNLMHTWLLDAYYEVRCKIFNFFRVVYRGSVFKVRNGGGGGNVSEVVQLPTALREGCPASPTLFNICMNDIV